MLTKEVFDMQISRLVDVFGEKAFSDERQRIIWHYCSALKNETFVKLINMIIANNRSAPVPSDFLEAIRLEMKSGEVFKIKKMCQTCEGDGYISRIKIIEGREYSYAFRCLDTTCPANPPLNAPYYSNEMQREFEG